MSPTPDRPVLVTDDEVGHVGSQAGRYQTHHQSLLTDMHMITPGIAASLTPKTIERATVAPRARRHLHLPHVRLHLPHLHLPHRHA